MENKAKNRKTKYYNHPDVSKFDNISPEEWENRLKSMEPNLQESQRFLYRAVQLRGIVMSIIQNGGEADEHGLLNILLCDIPDKLRGKGISLIDPRDLSICLEELKRNGKVVIGDFCYSEDKNEFTVFVAPKKK